jgi:hypothetical protein
MEAVFEVWSMFTFETMFRSATFPVMSAFPTTCKLDVGPLASTPTPKLPVVVSMTVFEEAPTNVIVSTLLKSSVPWGVARGIVSTMEGGFFKLRETRRTLFDTSGFATRRGGSYKVGGTLEEIFTIIVDRKKKLF